MNYSNPCCYVLCYIAHELCNNRQYHVSPSDGNWEIKGRASNDNYCKNLIRQIKNFCLQFLKFIININVILYATF